LKSETRGIIETTRLFHNGGLTYKWFRFWWKK